MRKPLLVALVAAVLVGWYFLARPRFDFKAITDKQVEQDWIVNLKKVDAIEFLNGGGHYADIEPVEDLEMDQKVVRPLVERLKKDARLEVFALIDQIPDRAFAFAARLPEDHSQRLLIKRIVKEADDAFPGVILRNYGYHWMYFSVLDETTAKETHAEEVVEE